MGTRLHLHFHLPVQPRPTAVDAGAYWPLYGPNACPQVRYHDERADGCHHLRPSCQISLEAPDAQDGKNGRSLLLCARRRVSQGRYSSKQTLADMSSCVVIGIVRFWLIFEIDLIGNLTGTSLTTFMLCSIELMLAGLCVNIPMLRPFYLRWRTKQKTSQNSLSNGQAAYKSYQSDPLAVSEPGQRNNHTAWIELVSRLCLCHTSVSRAETDPLGRQGRRNLQLRRRLLRPQVDDGPTRGHSCLQRLDGGFVEACYHIGVVGMR